MHEEKSASVRPRDHRARRHVIPLGAGEGIRPRSNESANPFERPSLRVVLWSVGLQKLLESARVDHRRTWKRLL
jgi:hypothetical protein